MKSRACVDNDLGAAAVPVAPDAPGAPLAPDTPGAPVAPDALAVVGVVVVETSGVVVATAPLAPPVVGTLVVGVLAVGVLVVGTTGVVVATAPLAPDAPVAPVAPEGPVTPLGVA